MILIVFKTRPMKNGNVNTFIKHDYSYDLCYWLLCKMPWEIKKKWSAFNTEKVCFKYVLT